MQGLMPAQKGKGIDTCGHLSLTQCRNMCQHQADPSTHNCMGWIFKQVIQVQ